MSTGTGENRDISWMRSSPHGEMRENEIERDSAGTLGSIGVDCRSGAPGESSVQIRGMVKAAVATPAHSNRPRRIRSVYHYRFPRLTL